MKNIIFLTIFSLSLLACNKEQSNLDSGSPGSNSIEPEVELVLLDIETSHLDTSKILITWDNESKVCHQSDSCIFNIPKGTSVNIQIIPETEDFLLESWGNTHCSNRSLACNLDALEKMNLNIEGKKVEFLAHDSLLFNKFLRTVEADFDLLPAEISIPDRLFLSKGQAYGKKIVFKFDKGECVYDGKIDICGVAHCDPAKVLALKSCQINERQYTDVLNESHYFYVPDSVRLIEVNVSGKIRSDEKIEFAFEFPVHAWKYEEPLLSKTNLN